MTESPVIALLKSKALERIDTYFDSLIKGIESAISRKSIKLLENFHEHLTNTYVKCSTTKTLFNTTEPVELNKIYTPMNFVASGKALTDSEAIQYCLDKKRAIISGSGGSGKTLFMKHFWLTIFEKNKGRVPIYIELRYLNETTQFNLWKYIQSAVCKFHGSAAEENFKQAMQRGQFVIVLDGFDEVLHSKRSELRRQILELSEWCRNSSIIISSRPDEGLNSWQEFFHVSTKAMTIEQIEIFVSKIQYEEDKKAAFIRKIRAGAYKQFETFLTNPLLVTMMFINSIENIDIPTKRHLFFMSSFDALVKRHDALKGFHRPRKSQLDDEDFKDIFSLFCFLSYYKEIYHFDDKRLKSIMLEALEWQINRKSKDEKYKNITEADVLDDLIEGACMLQKDGLTIHFVHRSFQEFFTAYCLSYVVTEKTPDLFLHLAQRKSDNVIPLVFGMQPEIIEEYYLLKGVADAVDKLDKKSGHNLVTAYAKLLSGKLAIAMVSEEVELARSSNSGMEARKSREITRTFRFTFLLVQRETPYSALNSVLRAIYAEYAAIKSEALFEEGSEEFDEIETIVKKLFGEKSLLVNGIRLIDVNSPSAKTLVSSQRETLLKRLHTMAGKCGLESMIKRKVAFMKALATEIKTKKDKEREKMSLLESIRRPGRKIG